MTKSVRIDLEAEEEIAHAIDRYETEREGLGADFWDELRAAIPYARSTGAGVSPRARPAARARSATEATGAISLRGRLRRRRHVRADHLGDAWSPAAGVLASATLTQNLRTEQHKCLHV